MLDEKMIRRFFKAFNERDRESMKSLLDEEAVLNFPKVEPMTGRKRILTFFSILFRQYPELLFQIQRIIIQGKQAAVHWTNQGVNRQNEPYENEGMTLFEEKEGRFIFISDFFKDTEKF